MTDDTIDDARRKQIEREQHEGMERALQDAPRLKAERNNRANGGDVFSGFSSGEGPERVPLRREIPPPDPFPVDALGDVLAPAVRAITEIIQCPAAIAGQSLLAAATLATQAHADVAIDGRVFPVSENFISVAESGERKSAADKAALRPHKKRQRDLKEWYEGAVIEYEIEVAAWEKEKAQILASKENKGRDRKRRALQDLGPKPQPPADVILTTEEPTYEGLIKALATGWPSPGLFSDEGGRFLGGHGMNQENALKTATGLSKLWDGDPITRTRGGDGNMLLYGRRVSVHLMVQPQVAEMLFGNQMLIQQGLMSRCLVCFPQSRIGNRPYKAKDLFQDPSMSAYFARMMDMLEADLPLAEGKQNQLEPRAVQLSPDAKDTWEAFHDHIDLLCGDGRELHPIRGFACKAAEHAARLAGTLALVSDFTAQEIKSAHIEAGIELAQFYTGEALRLFNAANDNPDLVLAERLFAWAVSKGYDKLSLPTVYQRGPAQIRDKATAKRIVEILLDHGWLLPIEGGAEIDGTHRRQAWRLVQ